MTRLTAFSLVAALVVASCVVSTSIAIPSPTLAPEQVAKQKWLVHNTADCRIRFQMHFPVERDINDRWQLGGEWEMVVRNGKPYAQECIKGTCAIIGLHLPNGGRTADDLFFMSENNVMQNMGTDGISGQ